MIDLTTDIFENLFAIKIQYKRHWTEKITYGNYDTGLTSRFINIYQGNYKHFNIEKKDTPWHVIKQKSLWLLWPRIKNLTSIHDDVSLIPGLTQGLRIWCCCGCGVGRRCGSHLVLLQLWCRLAAAALIWPLSYELLYAARVALKKEKKKKVSRK